MLCLWKPGEPGIDGTFSDVSSNYALLVLMTRLQRSLVTMRSSHEHENGDGCDSVTSGFANQKNSFLCRSACGSAAAFGRVGRGFSSSPGTSATPMHENRVHWGPRPVPGYRLWRPLRGLLFSRSLSVPRIPLKYSSINRRPTGRLLCYVHDSFPTCIAERPAQFAWTHASSHSRLQIR